jgi:hypothetical protein
LLQNIGWWLSSEAQADLQRNWGANTATGPAPLSFAEFRIVKFCIGHAIQQY